MRKNALCYLQLTQLTYYVIVAVATQH